MTNRLGELKPYRFIQDKDGKRTPCTFYAESKSEAIRKARAWGKSLGLKMYLPKEPRL